MVMIASTLIGILLGIISARRRNGNRLDIAQYAAGYGIAFAIFGLFLGIVIERLAA